MQFTADEIELLLAILQNLNYKIGDAERVLPLYNKLRSYHEKINPKKDVLSTEEEKNGPKSTEPTA